MRLPRHYLQRLKGARSYDNRFRKTPEQDIRPAEPVSSSVIRAHITRYRTFRSDGIALHNLNLEGYVGKMAAAPTEGTQIAHRSERSRSPLPALEPAIGAASSNIQLNTLRGREIE